MTRRGPLARLHGAALRSQLWLVLAAIPLAAALHGVALEAFVVEDLVSGDGVADVESLRASVRVLVWLLVLGIAITTAGAGLLLRGSLRAVVDEIAGATEAIARGDFEQRIATRRGDELGRLASTIDALGGRLEALEQARRQMLACVSHELRTPLTVIRGHAFTLERGEPDDDRRSRLQLVQDEAGRLGALVEDLVDASSIRAGRLRLRTELLDVGALVDHAIVRFGAEAGERGIALVAVGDRRSLLVRADPDRIGQAIANLVHNAIRHASRGSEVELTARERASGAIALEVRNIGAPISADAAGRIFEPFEQAGAEPGRLGLGLSITRGIVAAHGGTVELVDGAAARVGDVRFRVTLPEARAEQAAAVLASERRRLARLGIARPALGST